MKKLVLIFACLALLAGCTSNTAGISDASSNQSEEPTTDELTGNVFLDTETENHVLEGGGISRTITVSKEDALAASVDDYAVFVSDRLPLGKNNLELFGIVFDDGTGVTYYGCSASNAVYGRITSKGVSVEASGFISPNEDGTYSYVEYES